METTAVLFTNARHVRRHITRALASAGFIVKSVVNRDELGAALTQGPDMCIIDADEARDDVSWSMDEMFARYPDIICLLISHDHENQYILQLVSKKNLNNIIAKHGGLTASSELIDENELIVTCNKLIRRDIFGLEKYLATWGIKIFERKVTSTDDKRDALTQLEQFVDSIDCYGVIKNAVLLVADELMMNAMYNAPRTPDGKPKYDVKDRRESLQLEPHEQITLRYACDGRNVALSVTDQFGSLHRDVIIKYLQQCFLGEPAQIEDKQGGAGVGLFMVFNSITQLTFNIHAGVATEVIAMFYVRSGARVFKASGRSLNMFILT
jgi:hypothetical protein